VSEMRECRYCHRVGYRGYVPMGDYGWVCANDRACKRRKIQRAWRAQS
jgi:hypothetical protein